jgi:hypothetical protein
VYTGIWHHELWRDEAAVWLAVRDTSLLNIVKNVGNEGTLLGWFLLLYPFAKLGLPVIILSFIHGSIATAVSSIILYQKKVPMLVRVLAVFSYYFVYEYAVVARHYALGILVLLGLATLYTRRFRHPGIYLF